jgi:hypothetical protein
MRFIILLAVTVASYMVALAIMFQSVAFKINVMKSPFIYLPLDIKEKVASDTYEATAIALTVVIAHTLAYAYLAYLASMAAVMYYGKHIKNHYQEKPRPNSNGFDLGVDDITLTVTFDIPVDGIPKEALDLFPTCKNIYQKGREVALQNKALGTGDRKSKGSYTFTNLMPASFIRVDRSDINISNKTAQDENLDALYKAGIQLLHKHQDWPAAATEHHGAASLLEHSIITSRNLMELTNGHKSASIIGLFHDIGKLLSYENNSKWIRDQNSNLIIKILESSKLLSPKFVKRKSFKRLTKGHNHLSMLILKSLPEFKSLEIQDKQLIEDVMMYASSERTPIRLIKNAEFEMFKKNLTLSDSSALRSEQEKASETVSSGNRFKEVIALVWKAIENCNINDYKAIGRNSGFANNKHEAIMIPLSNLLTEMKQFASEELSAALMLNVEFNDYKTRDASIIIKALDSLEILIFDYHGVYSDSALFTMKSSSIIFEPVVLLNKSVIFQKNPKLEHLWGDSKYTLTVNKPYT